MANTTSKALSGPNPNNQLPGWASAFINIFFAIYSALCVLPLLLIVSVSFSDEQSVMTHGYRFLPENFNLAAYKFLIKDLSQIVHSYGISISVTLIGTVLSVMVISLYAYPISRSHFPQAKFFTFFAFFTMLLSGGLVPWYLVYVQMLGLRNTLWALIMPLIMSAFWVLIMRTFFKETVPGAVLESAKIDGAGELRIFLRIVLPLSLPVMATVALFQTLTYWNDWFLSLVFITDNHNISVQYFLYKMMVNIQYLSTNPNAMSEIIRAGGMINFPSETVRMAVVIIGVGPIVFAYPFFQKYFIKGLTVGSVKG
ncbi:carbohydrate ABC transporter permease [Gorillibacterium timonense]|uniref:carbohydrate ABC transporter permease n=1 Tax=Gorillibacterium timonense TaxID=1689269 RepID=UPI00071C1F78|nr:carbohydrate ABC transporter permease [Gorillibacterium timonense]